jgi:hypothetical protein
MVLAMALVKSIISIFKSSPRITSSMAQRRWIWHLGQAVIITSPPLAPRLFQALHLHGFAEGIAAGPGAVAAADAREHRHPPGLGFLRAQLL